MPAGKLDITFPNKDTSPTILAEHVGQFKFQLKSMHEPLKRSTRMLSKDIERQFDAGGAPPWEPLRESTIKRKGGDRRILIRTGNLKRRAVQYSRWDIDKTKATYSFPPGAAYGLFHQTGFKIANFNQNKDDMKATLGLKRGNPEVPARPFVTFNQRQENIVAREFSFWYRERMKKVGF